MNKVLAFIMVLLLAACTGNQEQEQMKDTKATPLKQYVDSMKAAYPNYAGNVAVVKIICEDFEKHITNIPGILEGTPFRIVGIAEVGGKVNVMVASEIEFGSLSVWCNDFDKQKAAQLDKSKMYHVTGGSLHHYEAESGFAEQWLDLGDLYINNLELSQAD